MTRKKMPIHWSRRANLMVKRYMATKSGHSWGAFISNDLKKIEWPAVKSSLDVLDTGPKLDPLPQGFRVIDVFQRRVVRAPSEPFNYVCLSYVWGGVREFQATTKSIRYLERVRALDDPRVPGTILDAMIVCRRLGQRYLWVDRLCILQDHQDTKHVHINEMGRIYHHAFVTIVAAAGADAGYGLHGVSARRPLDNRRWRSKWAIVRGNLVPSRGPWYWRGWTFQEDMLSRRMLLFREMMMVLKVNGIKRAAAKEDEADKEKRSFNYQEAVEDYTSRVITNQGDAINAFTGVCNHYLGVGAHVFGMPLTGFDNVMHWMAWRSDCKRRRSSKGRPLFPSWCWASIRGPIQYPLLDSSIAAIASWAFVDKKMHSDKATISLITPKPQVEWFKGDSWIKTKDFRQMRAAVLACRSHCMITTPPEIWRIDLAAPNLQQQVKTIWPTYAAFWKACRGIGGHGNAQQPPYLDEFSDEQRSVAAASPGRILAFSQVVSLTVRSQKRNEEIPEHVNICYGNKCVGIGYLDDSTQQRLVEAEVSFFALSASGKSELGRLYGPRNRTLKSPHPSTRGDDRWPRNVISAVAIQETRAGSGVFRRVGFGIISLPAWASLKREWRSVVLE